MSAASTIRPDSSPQGTDADASARAAGAFVVVDRDGRATLASPAAAVLLGGDIEPLPTALAAAVGRAIERRTPVVVASPELPALAGIACRVLPADAGAVLLFEPAPPPPHNGAEHANGVPNERPPQQASSAGARVLDTVLETVPECIKVISADGRVVEMNAAGVEMLQAGHVQEVIGQQADAIVTDEYREVYHRVHEAVMRGETVQVDLDITTLAGVKRRIELRSAPLRDAEGKIVAELAVSHDVTDRHVAAERLRESEMRFRTLADSAPIGIFFGDPDGRQLYANPRYATIWHMSPDESAGFGWRRRLHPDDRARSIDESEHATSRGHEYTTEHRIMLDDGTVRWVRGQVLPLRDEAGRPTGYIGTIEDVTEQHEAAEAEARALANADLQRALLEAVLEALPAGVIFADAHGRIERATRQARLLWGGSLTTNGVHDYDRFRVRTRGSDHLLANDERPLTRALRGETTAPRELEIERHDGGTMTVLAAASPVRDAAGNIIGGVAVLTDVSERVRLEAQLQQAQKMEAIGQLAGGIAHDFNNLLTVINGNLEFARSDLGPNHPVQQDLAEVAQASERARTLVRQLLAFSRKQVLQARDVDLNDVVRGADSLLRRVLGDEIAFATTLAPRASVVRADRGQLEQVLMNLAVNARDALLTTAHGHPGKGGTLTIGTDHVTLTEQDAAEWPPLGPGRYVRLTVSDTGHGMDATTRAHIFEPFFTTKAVGAGTGLGLAMVYGIVMQAGGTLRVDSAPGMGATFSILLPSVADEVERAATEWPTSLPRGQGTVLVVEDEAAVRLTTRRVLERQGYTVLEARHGADALRAWHDHADEIVACVTDLRMPEMGGRELATLLRAEAPTLPVVFVSGYGDDAEMVRGAHEAFVGKPFAADALVATLQSVIRG